jgi:hypothetical protein
MIVTITGHASRRDQYRSAGKFRAAIGLTDKTDCRSPLAAAGTPVGACGLFMGRYGPRTLAAGIGDCLGGEAGTQVRAHPDDLLVLLLGLDILLLDLVAFHMYSFVTVSRTENRLNQKR